MKEEDRDLTYSTLAAQMHHIKSLSQYSGWDAMQSAMLAAGQSTAPDLNATALSLFKRRMAGVRGDQFKMPLGDFLYCHVFNEKVYVFFLFTKGGPEAKEGVVSEQVDFFPSDQLITQFRMILS